jgi:addiction module RelE/StbE family toxin
MRVAYHKNFIKNFKKRFANNHAFKEKYRQRVKIFLVDPSSPVLKDHSLVGERIRLRAFSITGDVRVVYQQWEDGIIFLDIGTHNQVYER